ncbi:hypothetical protein [Adlercreutzia murintestinalis]|jgi:hypothetical protein|uniref:hypothetical protein n=1 Tax=Adlercreutzia murintestinalis TaxID=2941325 RepID=UPI00203DE47B|nr:hypothetical protein [Adlercreutzia murintestinalis]
MPALQVKDCPSAVYEQLRTCASEENRSISQQALTIIEDFLSAREIACDVRPHQPAPRQHSRYAASHDDINYAEKRQATFRRLDTLPPFPLSEDAPSAVELLARIRAEEAR